MNRKSLLLWAIGCFAGRAMGADYFVSPTGDDSRDGKSEAAAWRSAAKANASKFEPGDRILFARGGEWHESLIASFDGSDETPIVYADFGDATKTKPTFWGSDVVLASAFAPISGN